MKLDINAHVKSDFDATISIEASNSTSTAKSCPCHRRLLPHGWSITGLRNDSRWSVVGVGAAPEPGWQYVEVLFEAGSASSTYLLRFGGYTDVLAGETWTMSAYAHAVEDPDRLQRLGSVLVQSGGSPLVLPLHVPREGFMRYAHTETVADGVTRINPQLRPTIAANRALRMRFYGPQFERSPLALPLTVGSRDAVKPYLDLAEPLGTAGTLLIEATAPVAGGKGSFRFERDGTPNFLMAQTTDTRGTYAYGQTAGETSISANGRFWAGGSEGKMALAWDANGTRFAVNGRVVEANASGPAALNRLRVGHNFVEHWNEGVERVRIYPTAKSANDLFAVDDAKLAAPRWPRRRHSLGKGRRLARHARLPPSPRLVLRG